MSLELDPSQRRLAVTSGGGCLLLFGLAFATGGGGFLYALLTGAEVSVNGRPGTPADAWLPGLFIVIGLVIGFVRYRVVVALDEDAVRQEVRFFALPLWRKSERLGRVTHVSLSREVRRSRDSSYTVFPVRLAREGGIAVDLSTLSDEKQARRDAEGAAKLAQLPLHDASIGNLHVREPHELDASVVDTAEVKGARPNAPADSRITVTPAATGADIELPAAPVLLVLAILGGGVLFLFLGGFWFFFWRSGFKGPTSPIEIAFEYFPLGLATVVGLGRVVSALRRGALGARVHVDRGGLRVRRLFSSRFLSAADIEELRVVGRAQHRSVLARSDDAEVRFAYGLTGPEQDYLRDLLLWHLRGAA